MANGLGGNRAVIVSSLDAEGNVHEHVPRYDWSTALSDSIFRKLPGMSFYSTFVFEKERPFIVTMKMLPTSKMGDAPVRGRTAVVEVNILKPGQLCTVISMATLPPVLQWTHLPAERYAAIIACRDLVAFGTCLSAPGTTRRSRSCRLRCNWTRKLPPRKRQA